MKLANIKAYIIKNLQQIKRDPRMLGLSIFAPIIVTALFGSAFGGDLTNLPVYFLDNDQNFSDTLASEIAGDMDDNPKFYFNTSTDDPNLGRQAVNNNYSQAAIIFSERFTEDLLLGKTAEVEIYISYNNSAVADYIINQYQTSLTDVVGEYFEQEQFDLSIIPVYIGTPAPLPTQINISLVNQDQGWASIHDKLSEDLFESLEDSESILIEKKDGDIEDYEVELEKGEIRGIISAPKRFTRDILLKKQVSIDLYLDAAEPQASLTIKGEMAEILGDLFEEKFGKSAISMEETYYNNPEGENEEVEPITYFTPAILGFIVFFFSFLLTMLSFLRERKLGTMERILTSPIKRSEIIIGYVLSFSVIALIQATATLIATIFLFNAQILITPLIILQTYMIIYLFVLAALGTGTFLSTLVESEFQIIQFIPLIILPFMLLSGVWAPVESLPPWLRPLSQFVPLTYANNSMRAILIRGASILDVWAEVSILAAFALIMTVLGILKLNRKLK